MYGLAFSKWENRRSWMKRARRVDLAEFIAEFAERSQVVDVKSLCILSTNARKL
jgi:hypothetical protein